MELLKIDEELDREGKWGRYRVLLKDEIAYKKVRAVRYSNNNICDDRGDVIYAPTRVVEEVVIMLVIPEGVIVHETGIHHNYKCRAQYCIIKDRPPSSTTIFSLRENFFYGDVGDTVLPDEFFNEENLSGCFLNNETHTHRRDGVCQRCYEKLAVCANGIHFFWTKQQAENYVFK